METLNNSGKQENRKKTKYNRKSPRLEEKEGSHLLYRGMNYENNN